MSAIPPNHARSTWGATMALLLGLLLFALLMGLLAPWVGELAPSLLVIVGLALALVPALLWLGVFYLQDRREPEPKAYVLGVFALGALLAGAVGEPLLRDVFRLGEWGQDDLLSNILVRGALEAGLVYLAVRTTVYLSDEFDEPIDGMIYGIAAGLGQATLINFHYVLDNGGVDLGVGSARIVVAALALASVGGVVGYGMSQARFVPGAGLWMPLGVVLAALLDGVYHWLQTRLSGLGGLNYSPLYGLGASVLFAAVVLVLLFALLRRSARAGDLATT